MLMIYHRDMSNKNRYNQVDQKVDDEEQHVEVEVSGEDEDNDKDNVT